MLICIARFLRPQDIANILFWNNCTHIRLKYFILGNRFSIYMWKCASTRLNIIWGCEELYTERLLQSKAKWWITALGWWTPSLSPPGLVPFMPPYIGARLVWQSDASDDTLLHLRHAIIQVRSTVVSYSGGQININFLLLHINKLSNLWKYFFLFEFILFYS